MIVLDEVMIVGRGHVGRGRVRVAGVADINQPDTPMINYGTDAVEEARATTVTCVTSHYDFYAVPSGIQ